MKKRSGARIAGWLSAAMLWAGAAGVQAEYEMTISFPGYNNRTEVLTDFPVLVVLSNGCDSAGQFDYSGFVSPNGYDLRFRNATDTADLDYEVESWNPGGVSLVWVRLPALANDGTSSILVRWGADPTQLPCTTNGAVWNTDFRGVWHLDESVTDEASSGVHLDSTATHFNGAQNGNSRVAGKLGSAQEFDGNDKIALGAVINVSAYTKEAWVKVSGNGNLISGDNSHAFWVPDGTLRSGHNGGWYSVNDTAPFPVGTWEHVAVTYDSTVSSGQLSLYHNGVLVSVATSISQPGTDTTAYFGAFAGANYFAGQMDEGRISSVARSPDWLWASYQNQGSNQVFSSYGPAQRLSTERAPQRMKISLAGYTNRTETLTNFPVLVKLSGGVGGSGFSFQNFVNADGTDLRFVLNPADTGSLNYEIESWDPAAGQASVWVQVPLIPPDGSGAIWAKWGDEADSSRLACTTNGSTWANGFQAVWHLNEPIVDGATGGTIYDSTANRLDGVQSGNGRANAIIAGGQDFSFGDVVDFNGLTWTPTQFSVSFWLNPRTLQDYNQGIGSGWNGFACHTTSGGGLYVGTYADSRFEPGDTGAALTRNEWSYITFAYDNGNAAIYKGGTLLATKAGMRAPQAWNGFHLSVQGQMLDGLVDEVRVCNVPRSADWVWACYMNQASNDLFSAFGTVQTVDTGAPQIANANPTAVTPTSVTMNGTLVTNGLTQAQVTLFWGPGDGGTDMGAWAHTNTFGLNAQPCPVAYGTNITTLTANTLYYYRYYATNDTKSAWATPSKAFVTGVAGIRKTADASESGPTAGSFMVYRAASGTNLPLTLSYTQTGTAIPGTDVVALPGTVTIPAGATNASIMVTPIENWVNTNSTTVSLTLTGANPSYILDGASNATLTIVSLNTPRNVWLGGAGDWSDPSRWNRGLVPQAGDEVVITNAGASVVLSGPTEALGSLTLSRTLTFTNWNSTLTANNVYVLTNGTITCAGPFTDSDQSNNVSIVCESLRIDAGGKIDVSGRGYAGGTSLDWSSTVWGYGPGKGYGYNGAGYGGSAWGSGAASVGLAYGDYLAPLAPGSGGGKLWYNPGAGGAGGGAVRIQASGAVLVNGQILANGLGVSSSHGGGGSGGSIFITCDTLAGANSGSFGVIRAKGGEGGNTTGGGGGGRIAISCNPASQAGLPKPGVVISADRGTADANYPAERGTLFLSDSRLLPDALTGWNGTVYGITPEWSPSSLTISNSGLVFHDPVEINVSNDVRVTASTLAFPSRTELSAADFTLNGSTLSFGSSAAPTQSTFMASGSILLTNSSTWTLYSGATNETAWTNCGFLVAISNDLTLETNCWIYPYSERETGGSVLFQVGNLTIRTNAGFDAVGKGYRAIGPRGFGPGRWGSYGGASHGGVGGRRDGGTYGDSNAPVCAGSGSDSIVEWGDGASGSSGGGVIRVAASGTITMNGSLLADGTGGDAWAGGGSGGSIYLIANSFGEAYGSISAKGANAIDPGAGSGGGGGGRIAMSFVSDNFAGSVSAAGGTGPGGNGETGSVVRALRAGEFFLLTVAGDPRVHGTAAPHNYGQSGVLGGTLLTESVNSPADVIPGVVRYHCLGWTLDGNEALSGTETQVVFTLTNNTTLTWHWTNAYYLAASAGPNGALLTDPSGWYTNGTAVTLTPSPSAGYHFSQWSGTGVPDGAHTNGSLTVTMTRARTIAAQFAKDGAGEAKTWTGSGDWFSATNWSGGNAPGALDTVTIAGGSVTLTDPTSMGSLTVNGGTLRVLKTDEAAVKLQVTGQVNLTGTATSLTLSNSTLQCGSAALSSSASVYVVAGPTNWSGTNYAALVDVAGNVTLDTGCWIYPTSDPFSTNGYGAVFKMVNLTIASNAGFNARGRGWAGVYPGATGYGLGAGSGYGGAGHGGAGSPGAGSPAGVGRTYDSSNAPVQPGSGGGSVAYNFERGGNGGGLIRIESAGIVSLSGRLDADGEAGGYHAGSGSGGSIWLICHRLQGPDYAAITARGGGQTSGGAGGGRIALYDMSQANYLGTISVAGGVGEWDAGAEGTYYRLQLRYPGTVFTMR